MTAVLAPLRTSFDRFLQTGLRAALSSFFPLRGATALASCTFEGLDLGVPRQDAADSRDLGLTHAAPLKIVVRLWVRDGNNVIVDVKEQELFFGEVPLLGDDGCFVIDGARRHLVPRRQTLWLPSDGPPTSPRERWMGPGEWLEQAFWVGLQPLRARCEKQLDDDDVGALMPHDVIHAMSVSRTLRQFLTHPALCPVVDETRSEAWRLHRLCRVRESVVLNEWGGAPKSKRVDAVDDADVALDAVSVAEGAARVSDGAVVVSAAAAADLVEERVSVVTVDAKDTAWGKEEIGAIVDVGAAVAAGDVLVGLTSWPGARPAAPVFNATHADGEPRADASLRVPEGVSAARVVDVRVLHRAGLELLPIEEAAVARLREAHLRDNDDASERRLSREQRGHELPPGVVRHVRVTLHESIALAVGDVVVDENGTGGPVSAIVDGLDAPTTKLLRQPLSRRRRKRRGAPDPAS